MKLSELNPDFNGKELVLSCPLCGNRFPINVNYQGEPKEPAIWGLKHPPDNFDWDKVTLIPSIANHPQAKDKAKCDFHFSVINGEIIS